jgi:hypothetical protein
VYTLAARIDQFHVSPMVDHDPPRAKRVFMLTCKLIFTASDGMGSRGSIPGKGKRFVSFSTASRTALGTTKPLIQCAPEYVHPG